MLNEFELHVLDSQDRPQLKFGRFSGTPDFIIVPQKGINCNWKNDKDSVCFSYINGRLISQEGAHIPHYRLANMYCIPPVFPRVNGRLYTNRKIISFWANDRQTNNHFPSSKEVSEIISLFKTDVNNPLDISDYTLYFTPLGSSNSFIEIPIDEYVWMNLSGKEDADFWIDRDIKTHSKDSQLEKYDDGELEWDEDTNPYNDPRYRNFVAESKIRLTESDLKRIVKEVVKKIMSL